MMMTLCGRCLMAPIATRTWILAVLGLALAATRGGWSSEPGRLPILAPGVLQTVPVESEEEETTTPALELTSISKAVQPWTPHFSAESETLHAQAQTVFLRRTVWQLEFSYKPLRLISLPATDASGRPAPRKIWYLVYRVTNPGRHLSPVPGKDRFDNVEYSLKRANLPIRFFPTFELRDHETGTELLDRVMPEMVRRIHAIEIRDPNVPLYDSATISRVAFDVNTETIDKGAWGVATWDGVSPDADFVSVFVQGLTNAYRWELREKADTRELRFKTLQLNFWRPGDDVDEHTGEFRNGLPSFQPEELAPMLRLYGLTDRRDYLWRYRSQL